MGFYFGRITGGALKICLAKVTTLKTRVFRILAPIGLKVTQKPPVSGLSRRLFLVLLVSETRPPFPLRERDFFHFIIMRIPGSCVHFCDHGIRCVFSHNQLRPIFCVTAFSERAENSIPGAIFSHSILSKPIAYYYSNHAQCPFYIFVRIIAKNYKRTDC